MKKNRRVEVGPFATFYFENYTTMWLQVQEMLRIEKGGEDQIAGELETYNPLIPQGSELIATLMLEIDDGTRRDKVCARSATSRRPRSSISVANASKPRRPNTRTAPRRTARPHRCTGCALSSRRRRSPSSRPDGDAVLGFSHPNYGHMAVIPPAVRAELAKDFA